VDVVFFGGGGVGRSGLIEPSPPKVSVIVSHIHGPTPQKTNFSNTKTFHLNRLKTNPNPNPNPNSNPNLPTSNPNFIIMRRKI